MLAGRTAMGYAFIAAIGLWLALAVRLGATHEQETARVHYLQESHADAVSASRRVQAALRSIYENTRTLTLLPSVRKLDRHATNLDAEGREAER